MHQLIVWWFHLVEHSGYLGIFLAMAVESSVFPLPSEVVIPPAAFYAAQGRLDMTLVVLVGTAGSLFGSLIMYGVSLAVGRPVFHRYGKYVFLPPQKVDMAERFFLRYSTGGIFFGRLLPVVRHLQSIPAGLARMNIWSFAALTTAGAGIWCAILAWFGRQVIGDSPRLLDSPEELRKVLAAKLLWFVVGIVVLLGLYVVAMFLARPPAKAQASAE